MRYPKRLNLKVSEEDLAMWRAAAEAEGRPLSQWVRHVLGLAAAERQLAEKVERRKAAGGRS